MCTSACYVNLLQALTDWIHNTLLLPNVQDAVIVIDRESRVTYWNEGATRLFGWTAEEMLGSLHSSRFPADVWATLAGQFETLAADREWYGGIPPAQGSRAEMRR